MADRSTDGTDAQRAAWMAAAQAGDQDAYESLLTSLLPLLRAFVAKRGVDRAGVEDVVQEILLLIHRARHTWRPERRFDPWMWAIAANATTDALRRQTRDWKRRGPSRDAFDEEGTPLDWIDAQAGGSNPEREAIERQIAPDLVAALDNLPHAQRQAVELLYVEQLSVAEAAERAGVTHSTMKVRAHRGSRALRLLLRRDESS
jgi:RNA polymerase sigma factor (sigma-70 family)